MSAPVLWICACHPRDGRLVELVHFNPTRTTQLCREIRTGLMDVIPTNALLVTGGAS